MNLTKMNNSLTSMFQPIWPTYLDDFFVADYVDTSTSTIRREGDRFIYRTALPGVKRQDVQIKVVGRYIVIKAAPGFNRHEFTHTMAIPSGSNVDDISAELVDGVLTLSMGTQPNYERVIEVK